MYSDNSVQRQCDAKSSKSSLAKTPDTRFLRSANQCDDKLDGDDKNESEEENGDDIDDAMSQLVESVSENDEIVLDIRYLLNRLIWEKSQHSGKLYHSMLIMLNHIMVNIQLCLMVTAKMLQQKIASIREDF